MKKKPQSPEFREELARAYQGMRRKRRPGGFDPNDRDYASKIHKPEKTRTDIAAVSAAIVAAAVAVMVQPGPFNELNAILGFSVVGILLAYGRTDSRDLFQSWAFAGIVGFSSLLPAGFLAEFLMGPPGLEGIWICPPPEKSVNCIYDSAVPTRWLLGFWIVSTVLVGALDRRKQAA